LGCKERIELS